MLDTQPIRILLIEDNPGDARLIREALSGADGDAADVEVADRLSTGLARIEGGAFDAIILDLSLPDSRGLATFESVHRLAPRLPTVLLTGLDDEGLALRAVAQGAQNYLVKGAVKPAAILRELRFAVERGKALDQVLGGAAQAAPGKILGFMGAKGGCGATTVALNVAVALARQGKSVVAIELSPYRAGLTLHLRASPRRDVADLFALAPDQINATELRKRLVATDFGVQFLFAPQEARQCGYPDPECVAALLRAAAGMAAFVVVDLAATPGPAHGACAQMCDPFLAVMEREPAGVAAGKNLMSLLDTWGLEKRAMAAVLVTKNPMSAYVSTTQASAELGVPVAGVIPPATEVLETTYRLALPLLIAEPESLPAESLKLLAQRLTAPMLAGVEG
jgi:CheY-like chemotaxis protein/MinD-like ATPase involved in chromosome partitioning or flagellar assembly